MTEKLLQMADQARAQAHAPYSKYEVGAALESATGKVYRGCNVENRSYGATVCAERVAVYNAVSSGERNFRAIAVSTESGDLPIPCGLCLQTLSEFSPDLKISVSNGKEQKNFSLGDLYPHPFGAKA